jgi:hypothetical protein
MNRIVQVCGLTGGCTAPQGLAALLIPAQGIATLGTRPKDMQPLTPPLLAARCFLATNPGLQRTPSFDSILMFRKIRM